MKTYVVISGIRYAARSWNPGETLEMPDDRAAKYLAQNSIKVLESGKKEAK